MKFIKLSLLSIGASLCLLNPILSQADSTLTYFTYCGVIPSSGGAPVCSANASITMLFGIPSGGKLKVPCDPSTTTPMSGIKNQEQQVWFQEGSNEFGGNVTFNPGSTYAITLDPSSQNSPVIISSTCQTSSKNMAQDLFKKIH